MTVSCGSAGDCAAVGSYKDGRQNYQGFVATEQNGRWGKAIEVPGLGALNAGAAAIADVTSVSCASADNCAAGGNYQDKSERTQGFVVSERNGRWGKATEVPGLDALSTGGNAGVDSVSCSHAGNCAAGGFYRDKSGNGQAFVVGERNGRWGKVIEVPGLATLNTGQGAEIDSVSCSPAGNCAAGGTYMHAATPPFFSQTQAFVVSRSS